MNSNDLYLALQVSPENNQLRIMYLDLIFQEKKYKEVYDEAQKGLTYDSANFHFKLMLAKGAFFTGKLNVTELVLEELSELDETPEVLLWLAKCRLAQGNPQLATELYRRASTMDSTLFDEQLDNELKVRLDGGGAIEIEPVELPKVNFSDVGGMDQVKKDITIKIILPMKQPELMSAYGKKAGGGILLYGPPGCGKTHIARATAGEIAGGFVNVGIHEVFNMWVGETEKNMHNIFFKARNNKPCVVFFDEIDALGMKRSQMKGDTARILVNQFLSEMDGVDSSNEGLLIIGATNAPWDVDPAFRRPGRFDRVIFVPPPDKEARIEILKLLLKEKPVGKIDFEQVASLTTDFSGADLQGLVDRVIEEKLTKAMLSGVVEVIINKDIIDMLKQVKATTMEWFVTAKNYAIYSNEGGQFDPILEYLNTKR